MPTQTELFDKLRARGILHLFDEIRRSYPLGYRESSVVMTAMITAYDEAKQKENNE